MEPEAQPQVRWCGTCRLQECARPSHGTEVLSVGGQGKCGLRAELDTWSPGGQCMCTW